MTEPSKEEIAVVLDKAADVLLVDGWCKDRLKDGEGRRCAVGAALFAAGIADALYPSPELYGPVKPYLAAMTDGAGLPSSVIGGSGDWRKYDAWDAVVEFNNALSTTEDDVHDLLRGTAKELREQAQTAEAR